MIFLWALLFVVDVECEADDALAELRVELTELAGEEANKEPFTVAALTKKFKCVEGFLTPEDALRIHVAIAQQMWGEENKEAAALSGLAARSIPAPGGFPEGVVLPEGLEVYQSAPWVNVKRKNPVGTMLFVDGTPATARPVDRPAVYQGVGAGGVVLWTMYLEGDAELPAGMEMEVPPPPVPEEAPKLLNRLMEDLAAGDYDKVVAEAVPAAARYPTMKEEFESLAAIAVDQKRRADEVALAREEEKPDKYFFYMRPSDRWPNRQDDRKGILMGFDLGLSTGVRLEWKIGGQVVDGIGLKVGVGVGTYSGSVGLTVSALPLYIDFNIAREWQIELGLGGVLFPTGYSSVYPMAQAALQWDPSSPIQVTAGVGLHIYGVVPEANVGFLW